MLLGAGAPTSAAPLSQGGKAVGPGLTLTASDVRGIALDVQFPDFKVVEVEREGTVYQRVHVPDYGLTDDVGKPELPSLGRFVAIPRGARVQLHILEADFKLLEGYRIYPVQPPAADTVGAEDAPFTLDKEFYERNAFYPPSVAALDSEAVIRERNTVIIRFYPLQYNPAARQLRAYSHLRLQLSFSGGTDAAIDARLYSPYYEDLYRSFVMNYDLLEKAGTRSQGIELASANGCELLIITHPDFLTAANTLADWKRQKGLDTEVRTTTDTGSTAASIKSYIQNAYNTWSPVPSFILFLGDAEFIPTHYVTAHPYESNRLIGTDLYYATVAGSDYFPDITTGRLSVDTLDEANAVVNKIINYERNPVTDSSFYANATVAAYFQDGEGGVYDGYDDRPFLRTSEEIRNFLLSKGYTVRRIYDTLASVNPTHYNNGAYGNGEPLPAELLRANGFTWSGNATDINNAINAGTFLVNHRDHGYRFGWAHPPYSTSNIDGLTNGNKLPVILSMNCQSGWFDNETDDAGFNTPSTDVQFAEKFLRRANGGAGGVVAATRTSFSGHNDAIDKGMIDAIWPDFLSYSRSGTFSNPQRRMGQVLNYGKMYYATVYGESTTRKIEFEIFHYFGDPTMQIWVSPPDPMSVSHAGQCPTGATNFAVNANVNGALVTVVKGSSILGKATVSSGVANVPLSPAPQDGTLKVTATDPDYVPYQDDVPVGNPTAALDVSHADACLVGAASFEVRIVQNLALAVISQNGVTLGSALAVSGRAIVPLNPRPVAGTISLVVTLAGWDSYEATIPVVREIITASVTPNRGASNPGQKVPFKVVARHSRGYQALTKVDLLIATREDPTNAVYVRYNRLANRVYMRSLDNTRWLPAQGYQIGTSYVINTRYATLYVGACRASGSGNILTVVLPIAFKAAYGPRTYHIYVRLNEDRWDQVGDWRVNAATTAASAAEESAERGEAAD